MNLNYKFFLIFVTLGMFACTKELDINPEQDIADGVALSNDKNVKAVLRGCYDLLADNNLYGGELQRNAELFAGQGEIDWVGTYNEPREIFNKTILVTNADVELLWTEGYELINACNNVLGALSVVNEADRTTVEGEAKLLRAMVYFEMARMFGKQYDGTASTSLGVPLVLTPTKEVTDAAQVPRNTVEECYTQIIKDLTEAESALPDENDVFGTKSVAAAMLSRVYLQKGDYANARDAADRVIKSGLFELTEAVADAFGQDENTTEDVFSIQISNQDGTNSLNEFFSTPDFGGRDGDIEIQPAHLDLYAPGDDRGDLFYEEAATYCGKYNNQYGNISVVRLAEMYLTRAECNARLSTTIGDTPTNDFNAVHERAGLSAASSVNVDDILLERRKELAFEGFRIHDLKRIKANVPPLAYDADKIIYPIPFREMQANKKLVQNSGY